MNTLHPFVLMLAFLLAAHFLLDFPLQGDFMAQAKNRHTEAGKIFWPFALPGHALLHGVAVLLLTQSLILGSAEFFAHLTIDWMKCENQIGPRMDQVLHIMCKVLILIFIPYALP